MLFLCDKFVVRKQLKRFRMNPNCSLAQESIHLVTVTLKSDGCVNDIKFAQAHQHLLTIDCLLLSGLPDVSPCAL